MTDASAAAAVAAQVDVPGRSGLAKLEPKADAHARARELLQGRTITLVFDIDPQCPSPVPAARAQDCHVRDAFDRLLAYVVLGDGSVANETFVREGHARSFRAFPRNCNKVEG